MALKEGEEIGEGKNSKSVSIVVCISPLETVFLYVLTVAKRQYPYTKKVNI